MRRPQDRVAEAYGWAEAGSFWILAGAIGGEQAADLASSVTEAWKAANPDTVNNYARWGRDLGL